MMSESPEYHLDKHSFSSLVEKLLFDGRKYIASVYQMFYSIVLIFHLGSNDSNIKI